MELQIDLRLLREGTKWFAVALVRYPGCSERIPFCTTVDIQGQLPSCGGDAPRASSSARIAARDRTLASVVAAIAKERPQAAPIAKEVAKCFGQFQRGSQICSQILCGNVQAMLYIVDLHKRAEHDKNPEAQRELALLRECMEACTQGRSSFSFKIDPTQAHTSGMYRPMNNPWAGKRSHLTAGRNPWSGEKATAMASGRNPPSGEKAAAMVSGRNPWSGLKATAMASGQTGWAGTQVNRPAPSNGARNGMWPGDMSSGRNPWSGEKATAMASGTGWAGTRVNRPAPSNGAANAMWPGDMSSGRNPPNGARNGMWPSDMSSGLNPYSGPGGGEMTSGTGYAGTHVYH